MTSSPGIDLGLTDVHVLITGASGGIGTSLTRTFLTLGACVTAHYNTQRLSLPDPPLPTSLLNNLTTFQADLKDEASVERLFEAGESAQGWPVQILVVNHGIWPKDDVKVVDMTLEQWRNTHAVNLDAAFLLCRAFLRRLRGYIAGDFPSPRNVWKTREALLDNVCIVFIGSTAGKFGEAGHADYASSKSALMQGLMLSLKNEIVEIAPKGRVNCVNPGWVKTPMAEAALRDETFVAKALASTPLRKVATPEDVARQVAVLCSPVLSGHVSGVGVMVDGGMEGRCLYPPSVGQDA